MKLRRSHLLILTGAALAGMVWLGPNAAAEKAVPIPAPRQAMQDTAQPTQSSATAVFAGGCFWGVQAVFQHTRGVLSAVSGYAGGAPQDADYDKVSGGDTGHAESVEVRFDPRQVSYGQLLQIYFSVAHDPTQLDRQYPDVGPQYRSEIFTTDPQQQAQAQQYIAQLDAAKVFASRIVTRVAPLKGFYAAEKYHQNYATIHPDSPYIAHFDLPKIANLKTLMPTLYRDQPVLVQ